MTTRALTAGIVVLGIGAMLMPVATLAGDGRMPPVPPALGRGVIRPPLPARFPEMRFRHRHDFSTWWSYAPDIANGTPPEYAPPPGGSPYPPIQIFPERSGPPAVYPRCRTDSQKVPSEAGGERTINITRCY
jgi:hypothetical protein